MTTTVEKTNSPWQELIQTCVLGAGRREPRLKGTGVLGQFIDNALETGTGGSSKEEKILLALTATSVAMRAGQIAMKSSLLPPPPVPCPDEKKKQCSTYSITLLKHVMADQAKGNDLRRLRLIRDWLTFCREADQVIAPEYLPKLLDFVRDNAALQPLLAECGGLHFDWLLELNHDWKNAFKHARPDNIKQDELVEKIELGFDRERLVAFAALRQYNPSKALECLSSLWGKESFDQKIALLKLMSDQTETKDEEFLEETVLSDRRKEVRLAAAGLLARLPQSRLVARMRERGEKFVSVKDKKLEISLPSEFDKSMARDGIEESITVDSRIGQKAGWLYQIVGLIDPAFWQDHTGLSPAAFLDLVLASQDWSLPMVLGLLNAAALYNNADYQEAITGREEIHLTESQAGQNFLRNLPHDKLEKLITGKLPIWAQTDRRSAPRLDLWYYLELVDFQWSQNFSIALLRFIIKEIREKVPVFGHTFYSNAANFGLRMHVGAGQYLDDFDLAKEEIDTWTRNGLERFVDNLKLRHEMYKSFQSTVEQV